MTQRTLRLTALLLAAAAFNLLGERLADRSPEQR